MRSTTKVPAKVAQFAKDAIEFGERKTRERESTHGFHYGEKMAFTCGCFEQALRTIASGYVTDFPKR